MALLQPEFKLDFYSISTKSTKLKQSTVVLRLTHL